MTTNTSAGQAARAISANDKPAGAGSAAMIAAGIGCLFVGILTTAAEASTSLKEALQLSDSVGPLSGKTIFSVVGWAIVWAILHFTMKDKDFPISKALTVTLVLFGLAVLLTFPTFFQMFAAE